MWLPAVAIHRLGVVEIAPSPHHCFRTAHLCAQSVNTSTTEPVLSRSSRQRLGHLQSHFDGGWHVCQPVFPELQSADACRRVERRDCAHEALPRLQSATSKLDLREHHSFRFGYCPILHNLALAYKHYCRQHAACCTSIWNGVPTTASSIVHSKF